MTDSNSLLAAEGAPQPEALARVLEAAGLSPYLLHDSRSVAPTSFPEVRVSLTRSTFALLSLERIPVPALDDAAGRRIEDEARALATRWGLAWRGAVGQGWVEVAFGDEVALSRHEDASAAGFRLHEAAGRVHLAHQILRQRALHFAWQGFSVQALAGGL